MFGQSNDRLQRTGREEQRFVRDQMEGVGIYKYDCANPLCTFAVCSNDDKTEAKMGCPRCGMHLIQTDKPGN